MLWHTGIMAKAFFENFPFELSGRKCLPTGIAWARKRDYTIFQTFVCAEEERETEIET